MFSVHHLGVSSKHRRTGIHEACCLWRLLNLHRTLPSDSHSPILNYHWRDLPQVAFLLWQIHDCHDKHMCHDKTCRNKSILVTTKLLLRQTYFCCDKGFVVTNIIFVATKVLSHQAFSLWQNTSFVMTKVCLSRQNFVTTNMCLSWQVFVATKIFCHDKHNFVVTNVLLQQAYFCHNKRHVLLQQTWCLWHLPPMILNLQCTLPSNSHRVPHGCPYTHGFHLGVSVNISRCMLWVYHTHAFSKRVSK